MLRVALVGAELEENLGLRYLAGALAREGHRAEVVAFDGPEEIPAVAAQLAGGAFDVIGLSVMFQLRAHEFVTLAERVRVLGWRGALVAGGQHATFMAREILTDNPAVDAVVLGDGEAPLAELVTALDGAPSRAEALARVPGLVVRAGDGAVGPTPARHERTSLTDLPFPLRARRPRQHLGLGVAPMVASRGCYASCTFCSIVAWEKLSGGPKYRVRPPEHVAREMAGLYHDLGVRVFNFHDDNFWFPTVAANRERLAALARALRAERVDDIALLFKCRPNDVDRELFTQAKEMGMVRVYVGIETDAPAGLIALRRGVSQPQNQRALDVLGALDVHSCSNLLLFDPDTRLTDVAYNIRFLERNAGHTLNFCRVEPYGGTPLTSRLAAEQRLTGTYLGFDYQMREPRVELLWRLCHFAFHERNFPGNSLANTIIGLAYRFHLAKRFWPTPELEGLRAPLAALVRGFNESQAAFLTRAFDFASACDLGDREAILGFATELAVGVREADVPFALDSDALEASIEAYAIERGRGGSDGRLGEGASGSGWWHAPRGVALGLALSACSSSSLPALSSPGSAVAPLPRSEAARAGAADGLPLTALPVSRPVPSGWIQTDPTTFDLLARAAAHARMGKWNSEWTVTAPGVTATLTFEERWTGGGQCRSPTLTGYRLHVRLDGPKAGDYELAGIGSTMGAHPGSVYRDAAGREVHVALSGVGPPPARRPQHVSGAVWRLRADPTRGLVTAALYPPPPQPVQREMMRHHGCDPIPEPAVIPTLSALNTERAVHVGFVTGLGTAGPPVASYAPLALTTWLDPTVQGVVDGSVVAEVDQGTVTVGAVVNPNVPPVTSSAPLMFDPRLPDGRVSAGRHTIKVTWRVSARGRTAAFTGTIDIEVTPDGQVRAVGNHGSQLETDPLPLGLRYGATIDAVREPDGLRLAVRVPAGVRARAHTWRASAGRLEPEAGGAAARFVPPSPPGSATVTCVVRGDGNSVGVATYRVDL